MMVIYQTPWRYIQEDPNFIKLYVIEQLSIPLPRFYI
jgi:hypothetical protein